MNDYYISNTTVKFFLLLLIPVPTAVIAQETGNSPARFLSKAAEKTNKAQSYTIKQTKIISKDVSERRGSPMTNKIKGEIRYEKPYFFMTMNLGTVGGQKNGSVDADSSTLQKIIGWVDPKSSNTTFYIKSKLSGNSWENINRLPFLSASFLNRAREQNCVACGNLTDPEKRLKDISLTGLETINDRKCIKITAKIRKDSMKGQAKDILTGPIKKMVTDYSRKLLSSNITYWIRNKSMLIEKVKKSINQQINITLNLGDRKRSKTFKQTSEEILNYTKYNSATVPEKYKQKFDELQQEEG